MKQTILKLWILMAMLWLSISASAYDFETDGIAYNITSFSDLKCSVTSKEAGYNGNISIPDVVTFNGKELKVTEIEDNAFQNSTDLVGVFIPSAVITIGSRAFQNCVNLEKVTIQDGLCYIRSYSFGQCSNLKNVILPNTVKEIGNNCFEGCTALSEIKISDNLSELGAYAFANCSSLNMISLSNYLTTIKEHTFDGCINLSEIQFGEGLKEISDYAFSECAFMSFTVPNSVMKIGLEILHGCGNLETFSLGTGISVISSNPISNCPNVKNFTILDGSSSLKFDFSNENYTEIRGYFYGDKYYHYYTRAGAFKDAEFEYVYVGRPIHNSSEIRYWDYQYPGDYYKSWGYYYSLPPFYGNKYIKKVEFGKNAEVHSTEILCKGGESYAYGWLEDCESLDSIEGLGLKEIDINFAKNATSLKNIEILSSTSNICESAFDGCISLNSIIIGPSVSSIGRGAFSYCNNLKSIYCKSVTPPTYSSEFSKDIYLNCGLFIPFETETEYRKTAPWNNFWNVEESIDCVCDFSVDGIIYTVASQNTVCVSGYNSTIDSYVEIPETVVYFTHPFTVNSIGNGAFKECKQLESVTIPSSVTSISDFCFSGCKSLKNLVLMDSEHSVVIGEGVFEDCREIECIIIPSSVNSIGKDCFSGCSSLKNFILTDSERPINIPSGDLAVYEKNLLTTIDNQDIYYDLAIYAGYFNGLPIKNLYIGRNLSSKDPFIISEGGRFEDIPNAKYFDITIFEEPFSKLPQLETLTIGSSVHTLGSSVREIEEAGLLLHTGSFERCEAIKEVLVNTSIPPTGAIFADNVYSEASLIVPENTVSLYQEAEGWKEFKYIFDGTESILVEEIKLNVNELSLEIGDTYQLTAEVLPEDATDQTIIWESSNPECVTVDENGLLTALSEGTATIVAKSADGNCEVSCLVTVTSEVGSVDAIGSCPSGEYIVYNLQGMKILESEDIDKVKQLPSGVYIVNGKKLIIK